MNLQLSRSHIRWLNIAILMVLAFIAILPLLGIGWFPSHESLNPVSRVFALAYEIKQGDWYPRWLSLANARQGSPMFNYYSPAAYLIPAYLSAMGLPILVAMKLMVWLVFLTGGIGMYLWIKPHTTRSAAMVAAIVYMYAPYHFVDLYVRGAMAEFTALALLPLLFLGIDHSLSGDGRRGFLIVALSSTALVLTHNLSALMIAPFAVLYGCALAFRRKSSTSIISRSLLGPTLGLLLSAFYWLPMILEQDYIQSLGTMMTSGDFYYGKHFIQPQQWLATTWSYGDSLPGPLGQMSLQIGITLLLCALIATLAWRRIPKHAQRFGVLCAILAALGLLMTTALATFIYESIPSFKYVQFPWRFMGQTGLFLSAYCGLIVYLGQSNHQRAAIVGIVVLATLFFSIDQRDVAKGINLPDDYITKVLITERRMGDPGGIGEYNPIWSNNTRLSWFGPVSTDPNTPLRVSHFETSGSTMTFTVANPKPLQLTLPWYYFPGWRVEIDGVATKISPSKEGFINFDLPRGDHQIRAYYGTTGPRQAAWFMTLLGLCGIAFLGWRLFRRPAKQEELKS